MVITQRTASRETMQLALTGTLQSQHVLDSRITLRVVVMFQDRTGVLRATHTASTLIEYPVSGGNP